MFRRWLAGFFMIFGLSSLLACLPARQISAYAEPDPGVEELYPVFEKFQSSYEKVQDYSAKLHKEELAGGKWTSEVLDFHFKKPFKIRIKWVKGPKKDREIVFVEGANNNKILVKIGGLLGIIIPKISIDPNGKTARDESGHTIREAGLGYLMEEVWRVTKNAYERGDLSLKLLEKKKYSKGQGPILKIERKLPHGKGYPTDRLIVYVDENLGIPIGAERYDAKGKLYGKYYYADLQTNQGLGDKEFKL